MVECECSSTCFKYSFAFVLIDTWWNVNITYPLLVLTLFLVLIDTWWNVNKGTEEFTAVKELVLIDTWWNVNVTCGKNSPLMETVLIDTWWNVNFLGIGSECYKAIGFNRYMVECE